VKFQPHDVVSDGDYRRALVVKHSLQPVFKAVRQPYWLSDEQVRVLEAHRDVMKAENNLKEAE